MDAGIERFPPPRPTASMLRAGGRRRGALRARLKPARAAHRAAAAPWPPPRPQPPNARLARPSIPATHVACLTPSSHLRQTDLIIRRLGRLDATYNRIPILLSVRTGWQPTSAPRRRLRCPWL